jgi:hypothetical protein
MPTTNERGLENQEARIVINGVTAGQVILHMYFKINDKEATTSLPEAISFSYEVESKRRGFLQVVKERQKDII